MKRTLFLAAIFLLILAISNACAAKIDESVTLQWDWGGSTPEGTGLDTDDPSANDLEWHLYMRKNDEAYDYASPALIEPYEGDLTLTYNVAIDALENNEVVRVYFVLRSFYGGSESNDSNEVYIDLTASMNAPINLRFFSRP